MAKASSRSSKSKFGSVPKRAPNHLFRQGGVLYFRMSIPADLRPVLGKREFRYSLGTGYLHQARSSAMNAAVVIKKIFSELRKANGDMSGMSVNEIRSLVDELIKESLAEDKERRIRDGSKYQGGRFGEFLVGGPLVDYHERHFDPYKGKKKIEELNRTGDWDALQEEAVELLKKMNKDPETIDIKLFCFEYAQRLLEYVDVQERRNNGHFDSDLEDPQREPGGLSETSIAQKPPRKTHKLSETIASYIQEQSGPESSWSERSQKELPPYLQVFWELVGDINIEDIDFESMRRVKEKLLKMPKNRSKRQECQGKTIDEAIKLGLNPISRTTFNKYITIISSFLNWSKRNGYVQENFASGLSVKISTSAHEDVAPFSPENLKALFYSRRYTQDKFKHPHMFWLPVLGLYTGARIEELCQLYLEDVRIEDGVWILDINEEKDKHLKNKQSKRLVPLHPFIVDELNFPGLIEKARQSGNERIFQELSKINNKYGHAPSQWFGKFREAAGVVYKQGQPRLAFHSFRHTFMNYLYYELKCDDSFIGGLVGHKQHGELRGRYVKPAPPKKAYEVIKQIDYGLDLSHLKHSRFVPKD